MDTRAILDRHLCEAVRALVDVARICEAVRYTSGLSRNQWERVEKARKVAADADQFLAAISKQEAK